MIKAFLGLLLWGGGWVCMNMLIVNKRFYHIFLMSLKVRIICLEILCDCL